MSKKQPNRLAELIEHQAFAGSALPRSIADNLQLYTQATNELKTLLVDCLPDEVLTTCWVVGLTAQQITLSVGSMTAANHIRYLQNAYLEVLTKQSITFKQLKHIRVVVVKIPELKPSINNVSSSNNSPTNTSETNSNKVLSQNTKRTISQAAEHVTTDENLKNALLRLINDEK